LVDPPADVLMVAHIQEGGDAEAIRIISARRANRGVRYAATD
jgi:uncharacterized DUF497 family protein